MFADLDRGLREMGATDMGVGKRVKEMAKGFYGRIAAYEKGLDGDDQTLSEALKRNLYGTVQPRPQAVARAGAVYAWPSQDAGPPADRSLLR